MKTPVMLHRVIFGSMERFHGILIEHFAGAFPTWLAPSQVAIVPISNEKHADFAEEIYKKMRAAGIRAKLDDRSESMNYKIRESLQDKKIPYVVVVGDKEIESNSVAVRARESVRSELSKLMISSQKSKMRLNQEALSLLLKTL